MKNKFLSVKKTLSAIEKNSKNKENNVNWDQLFELLIVTEQFNVPLTILVI